MKDFPRGVLRITLWAIQFDIQNSQTLLLSNTNTLTEKGEKMERIWIIVLLTLSAFAVVHMTEFTIITKSSNVVHLVTKEAFINEENVVDEIHTRIANIGQMNLSETETKKQIDSLVMRYQLESLMQMKEQYAQCSSTVRNLMQRKSALSQNGQLCTSTPENKYCAMWKQVQCNEDRASVFVSKSGMGSTLNNLVNFAGVALLHNRSMCLGDSKGYGSLNHYFQSPHCGNVCNSNPRRVNCSIEAFNQSGVVECTNTDVYLPGIDQVLANQVMIWNAKVKKDLIESVLRFNSEISSILENQLELSLHRAFASNADDQICKQKKFTIGVHIRRGDKKWHSEYVPTEKYAQAVRDTIAKETEASAENFVILVASDDLSAVQEFKNLTQDLTVVTVDKIVTASTTGFVEQEWFRQPFYQKYIGALELFAEVEALARTDKVICTHSSNVCRLLLTIRKSDTNTITSLDQNWNGY
jgi:hypothetical protein